MAQLIASTYDGETFLFDLFKLLPDGERRVRAVCAAWGFIRLEGDA